MNQPVPRPEPAHRVALGFLEDRLESLETVFADFNDPSQEWRRLFSELLGTFFLVLVAAGGGMMGQAFPDTISRTAAVVAPGLMVLAIILFMGKVSGAHLNPAVSIAFALRGDFPWRRVPGYIVVQLGGADARRLVPPSGRARLGVVRLELPGRRLLQRRRVLDGADPHVRARERDPRHRVRRAEPRRHRRDRSRRLHRARRPVGQPDLGCVDEPGPHVRARSRRPPTSPPTGCTSPGRSPAPSSRSASRSSSAAAAADEPARAPPKARLFTEPADPNKD